MLTEGTFADLADKRLFSGVREHVLLQTTLLDELLLADLTLERSLTDMCGHMAIQIVPGAKVTAAMFANELHLSGASPPCGGQ